MTEKETKKTEETEKKDSSKGKKERAAKPARVADGGAAPGAAVSSKGEREQGTAVASAAGRGAPASPDISPSKHAAASAAVKDDAPATKPATRKAAGTGSAAKPSGSLRIRQIRSGICAPIEHKQTLAGLGLRRIRQEVVRPDTPTVRGQIHKIRHLVEIVGTA